MAYDAIEGLPDRRQELLLASLLAMTANIYRAKGRDPASPADFLPWLADDEDDEPEPVDLTEKILALNALFGGEDMRRP